MRRISWIDQRMRLDDDGSPAALFFGRRLVHLVADGSYHGEGKHDE
jgi:hypothetical protein